MQLEVKNVSFRYDASDRWILRNVSFSVDRGERVGLVGPSGYGKSTLSKLIAGYLLPTEGEILFDGKPLPKQDYCPIQMIYQHPEQAVNPRWRMRDVLNECWQPDEATLSRLGIEKEWFSRWPLELSGGELQRFCVARILGPQTEFLIADEMSTMLDAITQAQIWEALLEHTRTRNIGMLIVTHEMALADRLCTRILRLQDLNRSDRG